MQPGPADFIADLQPRLLCHARRELTALGLRGDEAEDLVQTAWERWLTSQPVRVEGWMRICIRHLAADAGRRRAGRRPADPLDMAPLALDVLGA